jgi:poly-gamma-glutamate system protein
MKTERFGARSADGGMAEAAARQPFRPRKGRLQISTPLLVVSSALVLAAAAAATVAARSGEWLGLADASSRLSRSDLLQQAVRAKQAAQLAERHLREAKLAAGIQPDAGLSQSDSPWLGDELTPLVTTLGSLEAKRLAANPDWARVLTLRLYEAGVRSNSVVAAGCSGSFPGLNLALACACQALGAELIAISSVTASTWGANQPGFTWPEIEARLASAGLLRPASVAVSVGGQGDMALDLEPPARLRAQAIQRAACAALGATALTPTSLRDSVEQRLQLYQRQAHGRRITLYVNVGGTEASLGESAAALRLRSGFVPAKPFDLSPGRGVIGRFAEQGVPTLSLLHVEGLAFRWGVTP